MPDNFRLKHFKMSVQFKEVDPPTPVTLCQARDTGLQKVQSYKTPQDSSFSSSCPPVMSVVCATSEFALKGRAGPGINCHERHSLLQLALGHDSNVTRRSHGLSLKQNSCAW